MSGDRESFAGNSPLQSNRIDILTSIGVVAQIISSMSVVCPIVSA